MTESDTLSATDVEQTTNHLRALEGRRYEAVVSGDFDAFAALCHPELVYTHSNGERDSLESYLQKCRAGHYVYHRIEHPIENIIVVGDVAVVVGEMNADITAAGAAKRLENSAIGVWVREDDDWKFLAYQPTPKPVAAA